MLQRVESEEGETRRVEPFPVDAEHGALLSRHLHTKYPMLLTREAHEANGLKRVTTAKRVESGREALASCRGECFMYLVGNIERDQVREVASNELAYFGELFEMLHDG